MKRIGITHGRNGNISLTVDANNVAIVKTAAELAPYLAKLGLPDHANVHVQLANGRYFQVPARTYKKELLMPLDSEPWTPPERPERCPLHEALREALGREPLHADWEMLKQKCQVELARLNNAEAT